MSKNKTLEGKKILIFGGSGFIGAHLSQRLVTEKADVTVVCRDPEKIENIAAFKNVKLVQGDITQARDAAAHIKDQDIIVNLATIVQTAGKFDPYADLEINCKAQINVLEARKNINQDAQYIYIGSSMQFGRVAEENLPVSEEYPQNPISLYGVHKTAAEGYCNVYRNAFGLSSVIVRLPPVYGPSITGQETRSIIEKFIKKALRNESFNVNGFGKDLKDIIYVDDVINALCAVMESDITDGTYNIGSGKGVLFSDVAQMVIDECGSGRYDLVPFPKELEPFEIGSFYFDIGKIQKELGWSPKTDIREGIAKMVAFYKK